jgi:hypothetical protein
VKPATLLLPWVFQERIPYLNRTRSNFNCQLQYRRPYITIITTMFIITFIIIIIIQAEGSNGGSWSSNVKQTLCSQFNNKTRMAHRTRDDCIKEWRFNIFQPLKTSQHQTPVLHMLSNSCIDLFCCQLHIETLDDGGISETCHVSLRRSAHPS